MLITKELESTNNLTQTTYTQLLNEFDNHWNKILKEYKLTASDNCWIYNALTLVNKINSLLSNKILLEELLKNDAEKWKASCSIVQLSELLFALKGINYINPSSKTTIKRKLKDIIRMPLLVKDEDINNSQGRNSLFELRLASKLALSGYPTSMSENNPDILTETHGRKYAIECKRIYKEETLITNILAAKKQIIENSIARGTASLGIIAISVTRAFNSGGTMKLVAKNSHTASSRIDLEFDILYKKHEEYINKLLPNNIPALIFDYSDVVETDMRFWIQKQLFVKLGNNANIDVLKDFENLNRLI